MIPLTTNNWILAGDVISEGRNDHLLAPILGWYLILAILAFL